MPQLSQPVPYVLEVGGQEVVLTPDPAHEFTATTEQVALGYGVSASTIREQKRSNGEEFIEGKHFLTVRNPDAGNGNLSKTLWTKRGIVRLGFFIRSARARLFRDMAEDLVLGQLEAAQESGSDALISAEAFGKVTGQSRRAAGNYFRRTLGISPAAVGFYPHQNYAFYLYRLDDVLSAYERKGWAFDLHAKFETHTGRISYDLSLLSGARRQGVLTRSAPKRQSMPRLLDSAPVTDRVAAAQELVQLEQRRAYLLGVLA